MATLVVILLCTVHTVLKHVLQKYCIFNGHTYTRTHTHVHRKLESGRLNDISNDVFDATPDLTHL